MKNTITRDKLVNWFIKNEPEKYRDMNNSDHTVNMFEPNVFHCEGKLLSHVYMVMTWIEAQKEKYTNDDYIVLITSSLLHDTGKPNCQETMPANDTKPIRNSFKGHEGVSTFFSIGVLKKLQKEFPELYTDEIIEKIIKVVSLHGTYIDETSDIYFLRDEFRKADKNGAIRLVDEGMYSQYEKRKFLKPTQKDLGKNLTVLVGLPNSCKSTLRAKIQKLDKHLFVISRDDLLEDFYERKTNKIDTYNIMYKFLHEDKELLKEFNREFEEQLNYAAKVKTDVLIDMTQLSLSSRRKMINHFQKFNKKAVVIMTDNDELFTRNHIRYIETKKFISEKVIENMMTSFTFPVLEEGFDNIKLIIN
jgi:predicted kinase